MAIGMNAPDFRATSTSAATTGEPSAFITTTDQRPPRASHSISCSPVPVALSVQKSWSSGELDERCAARRRYRGDRPSISTTSE